MAKHVFYNASVVVNAVDLSNRVESVEVIMQTNEQPAAAVSEIQDYNMPGTLMITNPKITFYQDYAAANVYATFYAAWAARTTFNLVCKNDAGATSATNPAWTIPVFVKEAPFLTGKRGERHMAPVTCSVAGAATVATS